MKYEIEASVLAEVEKKLMQLPYYLAEQILPLIRQAKLVEEKEPEEMV
jgi:hypothetical protein